MKRIRLIMILLFSLFLISCGSGGSGEENTGNEIIIDSNNDVNDIGNDDSNIISDADVEPPTTPYVMAISISSSEIALNWQASTDNISVSGYKVYRNGNYLISVNTIAMNDTGLTAETEYCYSVSAFDSTGNESDHNYQSCTWTSPVPIVPDTESPTIPTNLTAIVVSSSEVQLSWTASTDNIAVSGYKIYRDGNYLNFITSTSANDTGLTGETQYCYAILAVDSSGNESAQTDQVCATTPQTPWQMLSGYYMTNIDADSNGNIYIAGDVPDYDGSYEKDIFLAKFDVNGIRQWVVKRGSVKTGADTGNEHVADFQIYNDTIYFSWCYNAAGGTYNCGKVYASAYDSNGNNLWDYELASSSTGDGSTDHDTYVDAIATGASGIYISYHDQNYSRKITKLDFSGNLSKEISLSLPSGGLQSYGDNLYSIGSMRTLYIVKYDSDLNALWDISWLDGYNLLGYGYSADATGLYYSGGIVASSDTAWITNFLLVKFDSDGQLLWEVDDVDLPQTGMVVADDSAVYTGANGYLGKYDKSNGSRVWLISTLSTEDTQDLAVYGGTIFTVHNDQSNNITRYSASTGSRY